MGQGEGSSGRCGYGSERRKSLLDLVVSTAFSICDYEDEDEDEDLRT
jgi:hypothetical protein